MPTLSTPADQSPSVRLPRLDLALLALLIVLTLFARALPDARTIDDAFITFRYSRNIIAGHGFVYNPDSRVLGTTTPLYTLLMAAIGAVTRGDNFPAYALIVNALADAGTVVLLYLLMRRVTANRWMGLLIGVLWTIAPRSVTFAIGGMETSVAILLMTGAVYCLLTDRPIWLGVLAALGILTRIDVGLLVALLFAQQAWERLQHHARPPWRTWIATLITLAPWLIFSTLYFGSPLSRSASAKTVAYALPAGSALVSFIQAYSTPFFEFDAFGGRGALIGIFVYVVLAAIGTLYAVRREPRLLGWLIYPWLYAAAFAIANPLIFRWYLTPPLPPFFFAIVCGAWAIVDTLRYAGKRTATRNSPPLRSPIYTILIVPAVLWIGTSLNAWTLHPDHGPDRPAPLMAWNKIELYYQRIGLELRDKYGVTASTRVASADIGAIGYFSNATIIDTVGLVTPALSSYYPIDKALIVEGQNYAIPPALILDTQPSYLVTMEAFVRLGLVPNATFQSDYQLLDEIPTDFYGTGMRLYGRR